MATLFEAAAAGDAAAIRRLAAGGDDVNARHATTRLTPLHAAAAHGDPATIRALLSLGAAPDAAGPEGLTPLHVAAARGDVCAIASLVINGRARIDRRDAYERTPLHVAAGTAGNAHAVQALLDLGAPQYARGFLCGTPLHAACGGGDMACVRALVAARGRGGGRAWLQELSFRGTPLTHAVHGGHAATVTALVREFGATPTYDDWKCAVELGRASMVRTLLALGPAPADPDHCDTLLHRAADCGDAATVAAVVEAVGVSGVWETNWDGQTPLHLAAMAPLSEDAAACRDTPLALLLRLGADPNVRDTYVAGPQPSLVSWAAVPRAHRPALMSAGADPYA